MKSSAKASWNVVKKILRFLGLFLLFLFVGSFLVFFKTDRDPDNLEAAFSYPASAFYEYDGCRIHYRDTGKGPALLLLHGTGSSLHTWDLWTQELQDSFRVISMDLPGFGLTGPDPKGIYSADRYGEIVLALADHLGLDRFHLAGNSLGGGIAWSLAARNPDRIDALILLDPSGIPKQEGETSPLVFRLAQNRLLSPFVRWVTPRFLVEESLLDVYYNDRLVTDSLVDRYYELQLREGNRQAFIDRAQQEFFPNGRPSISNVRVPTLILWGAEDEWIPVAEAPLFADSIQGSELIIYPNCGHLPMEELPRKTAAKVRQFLEK